MTTSTSTRPALIYDPPYDSPIEELFAHNAIKYLAEDVYLEKQVDVPTIGPTFRLDFVLTRDCQRIGVECDGREFHDEYRDEWRDALILASGAIDIIYRFRGADLTYHIEDLLYLMSGADPSFFSDRGRTNLEKLASDQAHGFSGSDLTPGEAVHYPPDPENGHHGIRAIYIKRWLRIVPIGRRALWWDWFVGARRHAGRTRDLDQMIALHKAWLEDLKADKVSAGCYCEGCGELIERRDIRAVWNSRIVCSQCYATHFSRGR